MKKSLNTAVGTALELRARGERGLSQSTENAILLAGAVAIAALVIVAVQSFVTGQMKLLKA